MSNGKNMLVAYWCREKLPNYLAQEMSSKKIHSGALNCFAFLSSSKLPETKKYKIISFTNINPWPISNTHRKKKTVFSWLDQHSSLFGGQKETIFQII
jgi:hypothetical protein